MQPQRKPDLGERVTSVIDHPNVLLVAAVVFFWTAWMQSWPSSAHENLTPLAERREAWGRMMTDALFGLVLIGAGVRGHCVRRMRKYASDLSNQQSQGFGGTVPERAGAPPTPLRMNSTKFLILASLVALVWSGIEWRAGQEGNAIRILQLIALGLLGGVISQIIWTSRTTREERVAHRNMSDAERGQFEQRARDYENYAFIRCGLPTFVLTRLVYYF